MPYDLFISYSRRDNERGQVSALKAQIGCGFRAFAGRDLRVFFDTREIAGMDDWREKIQRGLRDSQLFLAVLSPHYLASHYCRWEWEDYVRYEAMRQCLGEGIAPVFFVTLPDAADPNTDQALARWIDEIQHRQTFDLRPWYDAGEQTLKQAHVRKTLEQLQASVRERLDRAERSRRSPNNLIKHNPAFVGRMRELTELRNVLAKNKLGVVGAREGQMPGRATVQGLGGMGKTELALAYAHAFAWDYPGGRWQIPCEHLGDLRAALLHLANSNALNFEFTEDEKKNIALGFERVLRELNRRERCLLILDNVDDPNLLQPEYLDRLPRDGRVDLIATTRLAPRAIPGSAQEQSFIAVDELPEEDALALMRSHQLEGRFASQQEDEQARAIVRLLRGFTLAVETAGMYLGRITAPDVCRKFHERLKSALLSESEKAAGDDAVATRHRERLLEKTLAFTLQTLTPEALHLLEIASLLPADQIALPWLKAVGAEKFPAFTAEPAEPHAAFRQAEEQLLGLRLFQSAGVANDDSRLLVVRMHRLVQLLVAQRKEFEKEQVFENLVGHAEIRCHFLEKDWLNWSNRWEIEPLRAFAEALLPLDHPRASEVVNSVAQRLYYLARYAEAERLYRQALILDERRFGPRHSTIAVRLNNLVVLLKDTKRLVEAEALMLRVLEIDEGCFGRNNCTVATDLSNLGAVLAESKRFDDAERVLQRALAIDEQNLGSHHPNVASDLSNLAQVLIGLNRQAAAEPLLQRALTIDEQNFGYNHPNVAVDLNNLGELLRASNRLKEAEPLLQRALTIDEQNFGDSHPNVATELMNLALLKRATNRLAEAEPLVRRALAIYERVMGAGHLKVATALNALAEILRLTNRTTEAESLYRRALAIDEQSSGADVAPHLNNLALLLQATHRFTEAEAHYRRALAIDEKNSMPTLGAAERLSNLASLLFATNRLGQAGPLFRRALAINEALCGETHPAVATSLVWVAHLLKSTNQATEAEPLLQRALRILLDLRRSGHDNPHLNTVYQNYGALLMQLGFSQAEAVEKVNTLCREYDLPSGSE